MSSELLEFLCSNLSVDDVLDLCDHVDRMLDSSDVTNRIKTSTQLSHMLSVLVDYLWCQDGATLALLLRYIQQDYNFIAYRIRKEYQLSHKVITDSQQDQGGLQLMLVSRPPDPLSCHPMRLSVPSQPHEQWDHVITFAYTAPQLTKLDYQIRAELSGVIDENGHVIRVSAVSVFRCSEKCRTVSSDGTVPQISLWCRFKGHSTKTKQSVKFTLYATSLSVNIECASVEVEFQVKSKKTRNQGPLQTVQLPSRDSHNSSCDSSVGSDDTPTASRDGHMTTWVSGSETSFMQPGLVAKRAVNEEHLFQLFPAVSKTKFFIYDRKFGEACFQSMFKKFAGLMKDPQEFTRLASGMKKYFSKCMNHSDMTIAVCILESTFAYNQGDIEKSYKCAMRSKQLVLKAQNPAVDLAETNIQLVGVFRRLRKFGLAVQMVQEAQQAMANTELCQSHAMVYKCEASLYSVILQNTPHPNPALRRQAISGFWKALDILHQTRSFHANPQHHIKDCYLQLAEVYVDIPSSDIRSWRHVSDDDIQQAALCLHKAHQMISKDFYGRGRSKLKLTQAKLLIRKGQLTQAAETLEEGIQIAQTSGALIDAQYCSELLQSITGSPEFALQKMKDLAVGDARPAENEDEGDGDVGEDDNDFDDDN